MTDFNRLHPDGAPGAVEAELREQYGDREYEAFIEYANGMRQANVDRARAEVDLVASRTRVRESFALILHLIGLSGFVVGAFAGLDYLINRVFN